MSERDRKIKEQRCKVCKGWLSEHNDWQREHCRLRGLGCTCMDHEKQVCDICQGISPLRVRGGTLQDFKDACGDVIAKKAAEIPPAFREQYDLHNKWLAIPWHERPKTEPGTEAILRENSVNDIEFIASLESTIRALTEENERLKAPVSQREWLMAQSQGDYMSTAPSRCARIATAIIAARTQEGDATK